MASLSKWLPTGVTNKQSFDGKPSKLTTIDLVGGIYCHICHFTFVNKKEFDSHYENHGLGTKDIVYTCVVCHKEIHGYPSFRGHCYLVHVTKDKFKCEYCNKIFSKLCVLQTHIKNMHEKKCPICQAQFKSKKELIFHKVIHKNSENSPPYECQTCGKQMETHDDCEDHIEEHCSMLYSCPICNEEIAGIQYAASHLTKHFGNVLKNKNSDDTLETREISNDCSIDLTGGIVCCYCSSTYKARQDFDNHFAVEHPNEEIVYACNLCGKEYKKYFSFSDHCYDHTTKDRFECEECFKTFSRLSLLVIHVEAFHASAKASGPRPFTCLQCNHCFLTDRRLKDHYKTMHKICYSQCPQQGCDKKFDAPKDLILHLKEHDSQQNWCKQCGLRFYSLQACESHLQCHVKKVYSCPVCNRSYREKYVAIKHLPQHFSAVLHVCKVCGKIYNVRNRLVEHMKVHYEIKQHNCSFCSKTFAKQSQLQQHLNTHTGLKPYKCTNCPKSFASYPNMRKHQRNMHNVHNIGSKTILNESNDQSIVDATVGIKETFVNEHLKKDLSEPQLDVNNIQEYSEVVDETIGIKETFVNEHLKKELPKLQLDVNNIQKYSEGLQLDTSVDLNNTTYSFEESNESCTQWSTDTIDPDILDLLEENMQGIDVEVANIEDIHRDLWVSSATIQPDASQGLVPFEYGPEFVTGADAVAAGTGVIPLDDPPLPHIDPRLTLLPAYPYDPPPLPSPPPPAPLKWEPSIFTKLQEYAYDLDATRLMMNTDIF